MVLRILIVVVAVLLGISLNMFQFRNPFPTLLTMGNRQEMATGDVQRATPAPVAEQTAPQTLETAQGVQPQISQAGTSPEAGPSAREQDTPATRTEAQAEADHEAKPASALSADAVPVDAQGAADALSSVPESAPPALQTIATVREQPKTLSSPVVVTAREKTQAAKIGRQIPAGVPSEEATGNVPSPAQTPQESASAAGVGAQPQLSVAPDAASTDLTSAPTEPAQASALSAANLPAGAEQKKGEDSKLNRVQGITFSDRPGAFEMTVVTQNPVESVRFFHSKAPARLAVDLPGSWQSGIGASVPCQGELMERVRVGVHPDKVRLVLDYKDKDAPNVSDPVIEKRSNGVLIRVNKTGGKS